MNILKSLFGSDSDLSRPDIKRFRDVVVDLSSNILAMPDVKHTAMYSISAFPEDSDIYNLRNFYESKGNVYALRVYERGWPHKGYRASSIGSTVLTITLMHFPEQSHPKLNFFDQSDLEISILKLCNEFWACNNTGAKLGSLGSADHVYPVKSEDFQYKEFNSTRWLVANSEYHHEEPEYLFVAPVSKNHYLLVDFSLQRHSGYKYYSPEHNLEEVTHQTMNAFMDRCVLRLSQKSLREKAEVEV